MNINQESKRNIETKKMKNAKKKTKR